MKIYKRRIVKQVVAGIEKDFGIVAILNKYKDTLNKRNDNLDTKLSNWLK